MSLYIQILSLVENKCPIQTCPIQLYSSVLEIVLIFQTYIFDYPYNKETIPAKKIFFHKPIFSTELDKWLSHP